MVGLILSVTSIAVCNAHEHQRNSIVGSWKCDPYTLNGNDRTVTVTEENTYYRDGSFLSLDTYTDVFSSGLKVSGKVKLVGSWKIASLLLSIQVTRAKYLFSDNPKFTVAMGQKMWDATLREPSRESVEIIQYGPPLVTKSRHAVLTCR
jgi:hypothetical protein